MLDQVLTKPCILFVKFWPRLSGGSDGRRAAGHGGYSERCGAPFPGGGGVRPAPLPPLRPPADPPAPDLSAPPPEPRGDGKWFFLCVFQIFYKEDHIAAVFSVMESSLFLVAQNL